MPITPSESTEDPYAELVHKPCGTQQAAADSQGAIQGAHKKRWKLADPTGPHLSLNPRRSICTVRVEAESAYRRASSTAERVFELSGFGVSSVH